MGNIITQANNDEKSYIVNEAGDFQVKNNFTATTGKINNFTADTGTFNNVVYFKDNIKTLTIDDINLTAFKSDYDNLKNTVTTLSSGAGAGTFSGSVSASSFAGTDGTFTTLKATTIDIDGNERNSIYSSFYKWFNSRKWNW